MSSKSSDILNQKLLDLGFSDVEKEKFLKILAIVMNEERNPNQDTVREIEKIVHVQE